MFTRIKWPLATRAYRLKMDIVFKRNDRQLGESKFLELVQAVWPGTYDPESVKGALQKTVNVTAWENEKLVGCVRILTDGYFFGTISEILVDPAYQKRGVGRRLMELAWELSPTSLFFGAQPGNEGFFEKLGYKKRMQSYQRKKSHAPIKKPMASSSRL